MIILSLCPFVCSLSLFVFSLGFLTISTFLRVRASLGFVSKMPIPLTPGSSPSRAAQSGGDWRILPTWFRLRSTTHRQSIVDGRGRRGPGHGAELTRATLPRRPGCQSTAEVSIRALSECHSGQWRKCEGGSRSLSYPFRWPSFYWFSSTSKSHVSGGKRLRSVIVAK